VSSIFNQQSDKGGNGQVTAPGPAAAPRPPESPTRREAAAPADGQAHLDRGTKASGKLSFEGPVRIDGEVDGEIAAKDSVTIGESAVVTADVHAASVLVAGRVSGNISASGRIELRPSARVECDLHAPVVVIHEGAQFEGRCSMRSEVTRPERPDRKLAAPPETQPLANGSAGQEASAGLSVRIATS
jgi:cytoskeletal protein CcmA (bactofilin family)